MKEESLPFSIRQLISAFQQKPLAEEFPEGVEKIQVDNTISRMAFFYEKFRNAIDYKEEHLLRKNAIERILKRRLIPGARIDKVARKMIYELIRARYLPNNTIPVTKFLEVSVTINNYILLLHEIIRDFRGQAYYDLRNWILGIAAVEIEKQLALSNQEEALVEFAYRIVSENLEWQNETISPKDKNILLYLAIHRALIKSDPPLLAHHLWDFEYGEWKNADQELIQKVGREIESFRIEVNRYLNHPLNEYLLLRIKRTSILFLILNDVIERNPQEALPTIAQPEVLDTQIRNAAAARYKKARMKLERSVKRSLIYLLFTKTLLALIIELPYDRYFIHTVNYFPLIFNILFHPLFLFFLAMTITTPGNKNTERIVKGIHGILSPDPNARPKWRIRLTKRRALTRTVFQIIYGIAFIFTFGGLISLLLILKFNLVSIFFFIFFLTIVSFLGIKLRQDKKELEMQVHREGVLSIIIDFVTVPIIRVGHWLSLKAPKINVFVFILDVIIEAPFKTFVEITEEWVEYIREKKEEIY